MRRKRLGIILLLILVITISLGAVRAFADFGGFSGSSDYGGGGGSSWGDSDSDWGGSYGGGGGAVVVVVVLIVIVVVFVSKRGGSGGTQPAGATAINASKLRSIAEYRERDPKFSEPAMQERISNLYVQMQNCWTAKNMESLRPYFTDAAYAQFDRQLESYRANRRTNYVERITVLGVELRGWYEQEGNDCMVASVRTRIVDYTKDDSSGRIISGSNTAEKFMTYEYVLLRSSGFVTDSQDRNAETVNCPNCAAPLNINQSAKCPYCGSVITTKDYDWVISSIKGISQQTR